MSDHDQHFHPSLKFDGDAGCHKGAPEPHQGSAGRAPYGAVNIN